MVPLRSETNAAHVYASSLSGLIPKSAICAYVPRSFSHRSGESRVRELTQHVRETASQVGEQDVGETTHRRNDRKPLKEIYEAGEDWGS